MWVNYPHMPTGTKVNKEFAADSSLSPKQHNILICHDNPLQLHPE